MRCKHRYADPLLQMQHNSVWNIPPMRQSDLDMGAQLGWGGNGQVNMSSQHMELLSLHSATCGQAHTSQAPCR
jgi:hypothetical protein